MNYGKNLFFTQRSRVDVGSRPASNGVNIRATIILSAIASLFVFPAVVSGLLALLAGIVSPLSVLAIGLFADILYYVPGIHPPFLYSTLGALAALLSYSVRRFFETSIIASR